MSVQTIKSAQQPRVQVGIVQNQAGAREARHYTALCGASQPDLQNDVYGRPVNTNTLDMRGGGPECNAYAPYSQSLSDHITRENLERPYIQIAPEGARGAADLQGVGRDVTPQDLYGTGNRGNFVRMNSPGLRLPQPRILDAYPPVQRREQNMIWPPSDVSSNYIWRG
jgi:hypothetical protein